MTSDELKRQVTAVGQILGLVANLTSTPIDNRLVAGVDALAASDPMLAWIASWWPDGPFMGTGPTGKQELVVVVDGKEKGRLDLSTL